MTIKKAVKAAKYGKYWQLKRIQKNSWKDKKVKKVVKCGNKEKGIKSMMQLFLFRIPILPSDNYLSQNPLNLKLYPSPYALMLQSL